MKAYTSHLDSRDRFVELTREGELEQLVASGRRYALIIGVENYDNNPPWPRLDTPLNDAREVAKILVEKYGFTTSIAGPDGKSASLLLLDPAKRDIERALHVLRTQLDDQDSLLIYYAGHGQFVGQSKDAYWIPRDGQADDTLSWIPANVLSSQLKQMRARSVLVVSDSCFSGAMRMAEADYRTLDPDLRKAGFRKSRIFISSGGNEPVADSGCKMPHSVFACAFIEGLRTEKRPIFSLARVVQQAPDQSRRSDATTPRNRSHSRFWCGGWRIHLCPRSAVRPLRHARPPPFPPSVHVAVR